MRTNPAAKRTLPNTSLPPLKRPFNGIREEVSPLSGSIIIAVLQMDRPISCVLEIITFVKPIRLYDRTRHLDLTTCMENLALVKRTLSEHEGSQIPDEWRVSSVHFTANRPRRNVLARELDNYFCFQLELREQQRQSEQVVESTYFETVCGDSEEPFTLVDKSLGVIPKSRIPYVLKQVRMNGRHLSYMLKHLERMPDDLEQHYESLESVDECVDLDSYVPSQPRYDIHFGFSVISAN